MVSIDTQRFEVMRWIVLTTVHSFLEQPKVFTSLLLQPEPSLWVARVRGKRARKPERYAVVFIVKDGDDWWDTMGERLSVLQVSFEKR